MDFSDLKNFINDVMNDFYATEADLLNFGKNGNKMAHERTISFRIGYIILNKLKCYYGLENYTVDAEYNKHGIDSKRFDGKDVYPDLLIHKRRIDNYNLAWIEVKKTSSRKSKINKDRKRLRCVTQPGSDFNYDFGVLIIVGKTLDDCEIEFYQNGELASSLKFLCSTELSNPT